ncbi:MAG: glutamate-1-semialdehyde 2,1-aminomutase [Syntrophorhabdales bacterium]|jgi:glutamate-1-semialdehyde 2,1-aminomutase
MKFEKSRQLQQKSHSLIPGGGHTYAKGDDQYPILAPGFIVRGEGSHVWDPDGNEFIEYGMGLRAVTLGHGFRPVVEAAYREMAAGINFTRPSPIEAQCAETLLGLIDGADMAKFAKNGSDATTAAVKLARAYTGKDLIALCGDQAFFSTDDWFIGSTAMSAGIPQAIRDLSLKFHFNDIGSLRELFKAYPGQIACVVLEAATTVEPADGFLQDVRTVCKEEGAVFILDEMITGFRWHIGGAQAYYGVEPDLSAFGKALANGFSVSALVGKREIMELGGLFHDKDRVFLLSTTHGAENHALAAAVKTMEVYKEQDVITHLWNKGETLRLGLNRVARELGVDDFFHVVGMPCSLVYATWDPEKKPSQVYRALFMQETIKRGLLMPSLVVSFAHTDADIAKTIDGIGEALVVYEKALREGADKYLIGRPVKPVFRARN